MLSTKPISQASGASQYYYSADNYYYSDDDAKSNSFWYGRGASFLNLSGCVEQSDFKAILTGNLPNGAQLGKFIDGQRLHRPGYDLTFNAPKSVSIMALVGGDKRILEAHTIAVKTALDYVERCCAQARFTDKNGTHYENTNNLTIAAFNQDLSRAADPHLHTHCVVMNATLRQDGNWRALASNMSKSNTNAQGFWERVREHTRYLGMVYRAQLAHELKSLGYGIEKTSDEGFFEITGVPKEMIARFQTRRDDIETYMQEHGLEGAKDAAHATIKTRESKTYIDREALKQSWADKCRGFDFISAAQSIETSTSQYEITDVREVVLTAIDDLSESMTSFQEIQLINRAAQFSFSDGISPRVLSEVIQTLIREDILLPLHKESRAQYLTTRDLIKIEMNMLKTSVLDIPPILHFKEETHNKYSNGNAALEEYLSKLRVQSKLVATVGGRQGTGKTETLISLAKMFKAERKRAIILAPTKRQATRISERCATPVRSFIQFKVNANTLDKTSVVMIDDTEKMSPHQLCAILSMAHTKNIPVILFGDDKNLSAPGAANVFGQIVNQTGKTVSLTKRLNQNVKSLNQALSLARKKDIIASLEAIKSHIIEKDDVNTRLQAVAAHYSGLSQSERSQTAIYVSNNEQRHVVSEIIRKNLHARGEYHSPDYQFNVLKPHYLSQTSKRFAHHYSISQWLRFNRSSDKHQIQRGTYYQIIGINKNDNTVTLANGAQTLVWRPAQFHGNVEVFTQHELSIAAGEKLKLTRNHSLSGLTKGEVLTVSQVNESRLVCTTESNKTVKLDMREHFNQHIDYSYAYTVYDVAQTRKERVICLQESFRFAHNQKAFIQQLSMASQKIYFYTENKSEFCQALIDKTGVTPSVLERALQKDTLQSISNVADMIEPMLGELKQRYLTPHSISANEAVEKAIVSLSENNATFTHKMLVKEALLFALGHTEIANIEKAINDLSAQGQLPSQEKTLTGTTWVSPQDKALRQSLMNLVNGCKLVSPLLSQKEQLAYLKESTLTPSHKEVFQGVLTSDSHINLIQGYPGTGKTSLLVHLQKALKPSGVNLYGLAPTHAAVKELADRDIPSSTLACFLQNKPAINHHNIYVLDESSMVGSKDFYTLCQCILQNNSRLIVVGDVKQLASVAAGSPFKLLQNSKLPLFTLTDIKRQTNLNLRKSVQLLINGHTEAAFKTLGASIITEPNKDRRLETISNHYLAMTPDVRDKTLVITPANQDRVKVNAQIRQGLIERGELSGVEQRVNILRAVPCSKIALSDVSTYKAGMVVKLNSRISGLDTQAGEYLMVKSVDHTYGALSLINAKGEALHLKPSDLNITLTLFKQEKRTLMLGDKIEWRYTDKNKELFNHTTGKVIALTNNTMRIEFENNKQMTFDISAYDSQHWDHAYAITTHASQGKTVDNVLFLAESYQKRLMTNENFLVAVTRARENVHIITDNKLALQERIDILPAPSKMKSKPLRAEPKHNFKDITKLQHHLNEHTEQVVKSLLGNPKQLSGQTYRFGSHKGSLIVNLAGDKRGCWYDFQTGEGGHLLQLIQKQHNTTFLEAISIAEKMLALVPSELAARPSHNIQPTPKVKDTDVGRQQYALSIINQTQPIKGTLAETYLRQHRGISLNHFPPSFRFHPNLYSKLNAAAHPALVVIAQNSAGKPCACQAIYLDSATANKANVPVVKQSFGQISGAYIEIPGSKQTLVAEGPETGLSLAKACPETQVVITLGKSNFKNLDGRHLQNNIVFCLDNDNGKPLEDKLFIHAANKLADSHRIYACHPKIIGADFNDVLRREGITRLRQALTQKIEPFIRDTIKDRVATQVNTSTLTKVMHKVSEKELA